MLAPRNHNCTSHSLGFSACQIQDLFTPFAFATVVTAAFKGLRALCLLHATIIALRTV